MRRATRLNGVARYKQSLERKAAENLGAANHVLRAQQDTLSTLDNHRESYRHLLNDSHQTGVSATTWRQNLNFLQALDGAIDQQQNNVERQAESSSSARNSWRESHQATQVVTRLQDKLSQNQARSEHSAESQVAQENWLARKSTRRGGLDHE